MAIWSGKRTLFNQGWVTLHWLKQLNVICRLYLMILSRYKWRLSPLLSPAPLIKKKSSDSVFPVFVLGMSWYWAILIFLQITTKPTDLFIVDINQNWHFQRMLQNNSICFYEFIYTNTDVFTELLLKYIQSSYTSILIFS